MTAYIATLEGEYSHRGYNYSGRRYRDSRLQGETMSGLWSAVKGMGSSAIKVVTAPVKGAAHTVMEAGRGIASGDIKRVITAPIKGTGHMVGETFRGTKEHAEWYYRPSRMAQWMGPTGSAMSGIAPFTGPAAPFFIGRGSSLTNWWGRRF